jgi:hypothetical protein
MMMRTLWHLEDILERIAFLAVDAVLPKQYHKWTAYMQVNSYCEA